MLPPATWTGDYCKRPAHLRAVGSSDSPVWLFYRSPVIMGGLFLLRQEYGLGTVFHLIPSQPLVVRLYPALLHLDDFPCPSSRLAAGLLNQEPRLFSLLNRSNVCPSQKALFFFPYSFFFSPQFSQISGFVSHLHIIKSKLLVTEEPVGGSSVTNRKGEVFLPSATSCLGVKGAGITFLLAGASLGSWAQGARKVRGRTLDAAR